MATFKYRKKITQKKENINIYSSRNGIVKIDYNLNDLFKIICNFFSHSSTILDTQKMNMELFMLCKKDYLFPLSDWNLTVGRSSMEYSSPKKTIFVGMNKLSHDDLFLSEDDVFDIIEYLYQIQGYKELDKIENKLNFALGESENTKLFCEEISDVLRFYKSGYELNISGQVLPIPNESLKVLIEDQAVINDSDKERYKKINDAINLFRNREKDIELQKNAIIRIANELERIREELKSIIGNDTQEIFRLAMDYVNNFDLRHNNRNQKLSYAREQIYPLFFNVALSTYQTAIQILNSK